MNFVGDPSQRSIEAGFGPGGYARLVAVKDEYDPENVFKSNTNIAPSGA